MIFFEKIFFEKFPNFFEIFHKKSSTNSGLTAGFLVAGFYFGHFGHQEVKISKSHKPIFCLELTKEQVGYNFFFNSELFSG
jgi:hypothetical protein